jgi:hypothetical protein
MRKFIKINQSFVFISIGIRDPSIIGLSKFSFGGENFDFDLNFQIYFDKAIVTIIVVIIKIIVPKTSRFFIKDMLSVKLVSKFLIEVGTYFDLK